MNNKKETVKDFLERLSNTNESNGKDSRMMTNLLHKVGLNSAKCVGGLCYINPPCPPMSINDMAQKILKETGEK